MTSTAGAAAHRSRHHRALARLRRSAESRSQHHRHRSMPVGALNIPVIKFSVYWWNTLHQPASVFTASGPRMPMSP